MPFQNQKYYILLLLMLLQLCDDALSVHLVNLADLHLRVLHTVLALAAPHPNLRGIGEPDLKKHMIVK
jgi:hypothetical protein